MRGYLSSLTEQAIGTIKSGMVGRRRSTLSRPFGPGVRDWEIRAVMMSSQLPTEIDKAIARIDKQEVNGDPLACLLSIPAYHVTAFWLRGKKADKIVIIDQPDLFEHLQTERLYGER